MFTELLWMNGYGQFVWTAFAFSFVSCLYLYLKTRIEFKKYQKIYLSEFVSTEVEKIKFRERKKSEAEVLSIN